MTTTLILSMTISFFMDNKNLIIIWAMALGLTMIALFSVSFITHIYSQIKPENNTQSTSPNNRTSILLIMNHGKVNYTISDFLPAFIQNGTKCPLTAHLIDNNNITKEAQPIAICYF
jgi:hypothetical protein